MSYLGSPSRHRIEGDTELDRIEIAIEFLARRIEFEGHPFRLETRSPLRVMIPDEVAERAAYHRQGHRTVDQLKVVEQGLDLLIVTFDFRPALRDMALGRPAEQVKAHLDSIERIPATMAESTQQPPKAVVSLFFGNGMRYRTRQTPLLRRSFVRLRTHVG
ncbi:MAG: hypothetical protein ACLQGP_24375 [Isosphaeraceae bacterium]